MSVFVNYQTLFYQRAIMFVPDVESQDRIIALMLAAPIDDLSDAELLVEIKNMSSGARYLESEIFSEALRRIFEERVKIKPSEISC